MPDLIPILCGAILTWAACAGAGRAVLARLAIKLYRGEQWLFAFVTGSSLVSLAVFLLAATGLANPVAFLALAAICILLGARTRRQNSLRLPDFPGRWKVLFWTLFLPFTLLYLAQAAGPEYSPDGSTYHLGYVARYLRQGGFGHITTSIYANLTQGLEMLFLLAFAFGRHSAAALVHFAFLLALVFGILAYAQRSGIPRAGICAALLVYLSPVIGFDGVTAYNDVAAACVMFYLFYALEIWAENRQPALLPVAGLLAGFAFAIKYTAFLAIPYALGYILWKSRRVRPAAVVALCAALLVVPWMAKNWWTVGDPLSPFLNRWFPNPNTSLALEQALAHDNGIHRDGFRFAAAVPDMAWRGHLSRGLLGPVWLLAPLALLSLRHRQGRRCLLAAGLFSLIWLANVDTRFLIPAAPFLALPLGLALSRWRCAIPLLLAAHACLSWPTVVRRYCYPLAMRVQHFLPRETLRLKPEEQTLAYRLPQYRAMRMLDSLAPPDARVFTFNQPPQAYTSREIVVGWESSFGEAVRDVLLMPIRQEMQPEWRLRFSFPRRRLQSVRVLQHSTDPNAQWSIGELRFFDGAREIAPDTGWTIRAYPNPWDAHWTLDRNPLTRWRSLALMEPGMYIEVRFPQPHEIDAVALDCAHDQWSVRLSLDGAGAGEPVKSDLPPLPDLRAAAIAELKKRGITHLLIGDADFGAGDFRANPAAWRIRPIGEADEWRLYALR